MQTTMSAVDDVIRKALEAAKTHAESTGMPPVQYRHVSGRNGLEVYEALDHPKGPK